MDDFQRPSIILVVVGRKLCHHENRGGFADSTAANLDFFIHKQFLSPYGFLAGNGIAAGFNRLIGWET